MGLVFPMAGVYLMTAPADGFYVSQLTIPSYTSMKLEAKLLPTHTHSWNDIADKQEMVAEAAKNSIPVPTSAAVGQTVKVSAVDANGKPTAWEAVDFPSVDGGCSEWEDIVDITTTEEVTRIMIEQDSDGNPLSLIEADILVEINGTPTNTSEAALTIRTQVNTAAKGGTNSLATRMFRSSGTFRVMIKLSGRSGLIHGLINNIGNTTGATAGYCNQNVPAPLSMIYFYGGTFGVGSRVVIRGIRA